MGDRLFRRDDQWAIDHSWQITKRHGGLSRRYRDPRFDTLRACPRCGGSGGYPDEPCATCDGIGRVRQVASSPEGQLR